MIDDEITLNGVEYIRKDAIEMRDMNELKKMVSLILSETQENVDKIIESYCDDTKIPKNHISEMTDEEYKIRIFPSAQKIYENFVIKNDGDIIINGRMLTFNMYDVNEIRKKIHSITNKDAKIISEKLNLSLYTVHRIIYNIIQGTFKEYDFSLFKGFTKERRKNKLRDDNKFTISKSRKEIYNIKGMKPTGEFYIYKAGKFNLNIHQVLKVKSRVIGKNITIGKAKQIASDVGLSYHMLQKVVYNLQQGIFDSYIQEWNERINKTFLNNNKVKQMPIQNNPEKRIEGGYYTGGYGC